MIDISSVQTGLDLGMFDTETNRAANILSVQFGSLEYDESDIGIDLKFFLSEDFKFQNEAFKAYLIQVLASHGINVAGIDQTVESLFSRFNFNLNPDGNNGGLVAG
jgi:hypothetical protein